MKLGLNIEHGIGIKHSTVATPQVIKLVYREGESGVRAVLIGSRFARVSLALMLARELAFVLACELTFVLACMLAWLPCGVPLEAGPLSPSLPPDSKRMVAVLPCHLTVQVVLKLQIIA